MANPGRFWGDLLKQELQPSDIAPDVVIVISPKISLAKKVPRPMLALRCRSKLSHFGVELYRALEYSITAPRDLGSALRDMASKLAPRSKPR